MALGFWLNRRNSDREQYFLARGKLGPATLGFSYSATQMSGSSYMGAIGTERLMGYNFAPAGVSSAAAAWFTYVLVGERLRRLASRIRCVTLVDVLKARYPERRVDAVSTALMLVAFVPLLAAQLKVAGNLFQAMLDIPYLAGLLAFGGVVILYTVIGGMRAVAATDLIQGSIMVAGFAILAPTAVAAAGGFAEMHARYAEFNPAGISFLGGQPALWVVSSFVVWGFFQIGGAPAAVTRFLIPEDDRALRRALVYSISFSSFIFLSSTLIAIAAGVLLPDLAQSDLALPELIELLLHPLLGAVLMAAILGATMSTIDSVLLLSSSLVVQNAIGGRLRRAADGAGGLRIARFATLALGALGVMLAVNPPAPILWMVAMAFAFCASAFTFPLLLGMWWSRATSEGALAGMLGGAATCVAWYALGYHRFGNLQSWPWGIWPALLGPMVSLLLMTVVSLATKGPSPHVRRLFFDFGSPPKADQSASRSRTA